MDIRKYAVLGAIVLAALGVIGVTILIALDKPIDQYGTIFLSIAGFLVTILTLTGGLNKIYEQQKVIARNVNGNNQKLIHAVIASDALPEEEVRAIAASNDELIKIADDSPRHRKDDANENPIQQ